MGTFDSLQIKISSILTSKNGYVVFDDQVYSQKMTEYNNIKDFPITRSCEKLERLKTVKRPQATDVKISQ